MIPFKMKGLPSESRMFNTLTLIPGKRSVLLCFTLACYKTPRLHIRTRVCVCVFVGMFFYKFISTTSKRDLSLCSTVLHEMKTWHEFFNDSRSVNQAMHQFGIYNVCRWDRVISPPTPEWESWCHLNKSEKCKWVEIPENSSIWYGHLVEVSENMQRVDWFIVSADGGEAWHSLNSNVRHPVTTFFLSHTNADLGYVSACIILQLKWSKDQRWYHGKVVSYSYYGPGFLCRNAVTEIWLKNTNV